MQLLKMTANYELHKQKSYYIIKYAEKSYLVRWGFETDAQKQSIFQYFFVPVCSLSDFR